MMMMTLKKQPRASNDLQSLFPKWEVMQWTSSRPSSSQREAEHLNTNPTIRYMVACRFGGTGLTILVLRYILLYLARFDDIVCFCLCLDRLLYFTHLFSVANQYLMTARKTLNVGLYMVFLVSYLSRKKLLCSSCFFNPSLTVERSIN